MLNAMNLAHRFKVARYLRLQDSLDVDKIERNLRIAHWDKTTVTVSCGAIGGLVLFIASMVHSINSEDVFFFYVGALIILAGALRFLLPFFINVLSFINYYNFMYSIERYIKYNLKQFVEIMSQDKYASDAMKNNEYYRRLIVAHHNDENFAEIAGNMLCQYYRNTRSKMKQDNDIQAFDSFFAKKNTQIEEKFKFME